MSAPLNFANPVIAKGANRFTLYWEKALSSLVAELSAFAGGILGLAFGGTGADNTTQTYLPVQTNLVNLSAANIITATFARIGAVVWVSGLFQADPTAAGVTTGFEMSLPVSSDFTSTGDGGGTAFAGAVAGQGARIFTNIANNTLQVQWISGDLANRDWSFMAMYRIQ